MERYVSCIRCKSLSLRLSDSKCDSTTPYHGPPTIREESFFEEVSAIIRLSRKYESAHLYHSAVAWLRRHFTPDTARFEMRKPSGFLDADAIGVLNLGRAIDSRSLLPGAIFACCRLTVQDLANGYPRDDRGKETLPLEDIVRVRVTRDRLIGARIVSATCVCRSKRAPPCQRTRCRDMLDSLQDPAYDCLRSTGRPAVTTSAFSYTPRKGARIRGCWAVQRMRKDGGGEGGDLGPPPVHRGRSGPGMGWKVPEALSFLEAG